MNEAHYAKLEKAGAVLSLEEIERREDARQAEAATQALAQQAGGLSGHADAETGSAIFSQKPRVLSGSAAQAGAPGRVFSLKPGVLSGWDGGAMPQPQASPWLLRNPAPADAQLRAA
jgi:hypothetical protein